MAWFILWVTDSVIAGEVGNIITIRSMGAGTGGLTINSSKVTFTNIKLALSFNASSDSFIDRSDLSFTSSSLSGVITNSFIRAGSNWNNYGTIVHSYMVGNGRFWNNGDIKSSNLSMNLTAFNDGELMGCYAKSIYTSSLNKITGSILDDLQGNSPAIILNSDVRLYSGLRTFFFDNSYIGNSAGTAFYDGYGTPVDQLGDGVAETVFTIDSTTYTVDGINNPRSTKNFLNGVDDLWNPEGVGALWNPNAADPTIFPEPAP